MRLLRWRLHGSGSLCSPANLPGLVSLQALCFETDAPTTERMLDAKSEEPCPRRLQLGCSRLRAWKSGARVYDPAVPALQHCSLQQESLSGLAQLPKAGDVWQAGNKRMNRESGAASFRKLRGSLFLSGLGSARQETLDKQLHL